MKSIFYSILGILFLTGACKEEPTNYEELSDEKEMAVLTLQKGINGRQNLSIFPQDGNKITQIGVNYGGIGYPSSAIAIRLDVDQVALDSINNLRRSNGQEPFLPFPEGSYSLDKSSINIASGEYISDMATLNYNSDQFELDKQYLIVFKASNSAGYRFAQGMDKVEFLAAALEIEHSKVGWSAAASSEELNGEGTTNGRAARLIDNNVTTFWHSMWDGGLPPYPHDFTVNFGKDLYVTRMELTRRQTANNGFHLFDLYGSKDGTTFSLVSADLQMDRDELAGQSFELPEPGYYRAMKVVMKTSFTNSAFAHCAEFSTFGY